MKRLGLLVALLFVASATGAIAQVPVPTPTPDPMTYSDAAMNFTAPAGAILIGRNDVTPDQLGNDLQTVATWIVHPGKEDARTITIAMESFTGNVDQWEGEFESQTHGSQDGTLFRNKTPMQLLNGMPAYYVEIASGSGFDARKMYVVVWSDGQRGVVLAESTRMGDTDGDQAKAALKQVTAVKYPLNQP